MYTNALLTDLYELTMAAAYLDWGKDKDSATFDLYYRHNPFNGGYAIAAGLETAVRAVMDTKFSKDDILFLGSLKTAVGTPVFCEKFLDYLASFRFQGNIRAILPPIASAETSEPYLKARLFFQTNL